MDLDREICLTIQQINEEKHRCATYRDIISLIGIETWSPETITRRVRELVEEGQIKRYKSIKEQKKATFFVISI